MPCADTVCGHIAERLLQLVLIFPKHGRDEFARPVEMGRAP
jgi:hypothetical protein